MKDKSWGWRERITFVIIWPVGTLFFIAAFTKQFYKTLKEWWNNRQNKND